MFDSLCREPSRCPSGYQPHRMVGRNPLLRVDQGQHRGLWPIVSAHLPLPPQPQPRSPGARERCDRGGNWPPHPETLQAPIAEAVAADLQALPRRREHLLRDCGHHACFNTDSRRKKPSSKYAFSVFSPPQKPKSTIVFETFWQFAAERQQIFFRRLSRTWPPDPPSSPW
jgi:hypothetical protein